MKRLQGPEMNWKRIDMFNLCKAMAALALCFALTAPVAGLAQDDDSEVIDQVVAVVNGEMITMYDMNMAMQPILGKIQGKTLTPEDKAAINKYRQEFLQRMIDDILIKQDAERYKIEVSDREIEAEIESIKQRNKLDAQGLEQQLQYEGLTMDDFRTNIRNGILKHRVVSGRVQRKVVVTDDEILAEYKKNKGLYGADSSVERDQGSGRTIKLSLIILPPAQSGADIKKRIESGEMSFAQAAKQYSVGPSADIGGDLGNMSWDDLAEQWRDILSDLKPGQISRPFAINDNEALLMVTSETDKEAEPQKAAEEPGLDAVKEEIQNKLYKQKLEALYEEYLVKLRETAVVDRKI